jgi:hypothetical protein
MLAIEPVPRPELEIVNENSCEGGTHREDEKEMNKDTMKGVDILRVRHLETGVNERFTFLIDSEELRRLGLEKKNVSKSSLEHLEQYSLLQRFRQKKSI